MGPEAPHRRRPLGIMMAFALGLVLALGFGFQGVDLDPIPTGGVPWGIHLSLAEDPATTLTFTWFTYAAQAPESFVEHGGSPDDLDNRTHGTSRNVPGHEGLFAHFATLTDLPSDESFHYRVGGETGWSEVRTTKTAPEKGPYRILLFADQGVSPAARQTVRDMQDADADLVLIAGDLAYAEKEPRLWDLWFQMNEPLFATLPMLSAIGNHEVAGPHGGASYTARVNLPGNETYYSFSYVRTHVLVLDSTRSIEDPDQDEMVAFARQDLQNASARRQADEIDHILVLQHHPLYSNVDRPGRQIRHDLIEWLEPLLVRHDVDLLLAGHNHHYERSFPLQDGTATTQERDHYEDPEGWIQVISGGAGRTLYDFRPLEEFLPITATHEQAYHYTLIDVDGPTLKVEAVAAGIHGRLGTFDSFTLTRTSQDPEDNGS